MTGHHYQCTLSGVVHQVHPTGCSTPASTIKLFSRTDRTELLLRYIFVIFFVNATSAFAVVSPPTKARITLPRDTLLMQLTVPISPIRFPASMRQRTCRQARISPSSALVLIRRPSHTLQHF